MKGLLAPLDDRVFVTLCIYLFKIVELTLDWFELILFNESSRYRDIVEIDKRIDLMNEQKRAERSCDEIIWKKKRNK